MKPWADRLHTEYEDGRKKLRQALRILGESDQDNADRALINGMINDMTFAMDWMTTGHEPNVFNGVERRNIYQERSMSDMDVFESLDIATGRVLTDDERVLIIRALAKLSPRERQCFVMAKAFMMTQQDIADELGIPQQNVSRAIKSAEDKLDGVK